MFIQKNRNKSQFTSELAIFKKMPEDYYSFPKHFFSEFKVDILEQKNFQDLQDAKQLNNNLLQFPALPSMP